MQTNKYLIIQTKFKFAYVLSVIITVLTIAASAGGLFIEDLYRDNTLITAAWRGNDLVTLVVGIPLLVAALIFSMRGSQRSQLVWLGMLGYTLYNYAFYLFGASFNRFFLIYVALFSLSIFALIFALPKVDINQISQRFHHRTPVKWIGSYMLFTAAFLGGNWISRSLNFIATGQVPPDIIRTGHPTSVVYALDLSLLVPSLVLGAILLWQRLPWGYVLAAILMVKCTAYPLALIAMSVFADKAGVPEAWDMAPFWMFFAVGSLIASGFLFGNMQSADRKELKLPRSPAQ